MCDGLRISTLVFVAGLSVIQIARSTYDCYEYAMQLFVSKKAFDSEAAIYKDKSSPLQKFLPKLQVRSRDFQAMLDTYTGSVDRGLMPNMNVCAGINCQRSWYIPRPVGHPHAPVHRH